MYLPGGMAWRRAELSLSAPLSLCKSRWLYPNHPLGMVSDIIYKVIVVLSTSGRWSQLALVRDYLLHHSTPHVERLIFWCLLQLLDHWSVQAWHFQEQFYFITEFQCIIFWRCGKAERSIRICTYIALFIWGPSKHYLNITISQWKVNAISI